MKTVDQVIKNKKGEYKRFGSIAQLEEVLTSEGIKVTDNGGFSLKAQGEEYSLAFGRVIKE